LNKTKATIVVYFALLIVEIAAELILYFHSISYPLYLIKPLLMPVLALWARVYANSKQLKLSKTVYLALLFAFFGDTALMFLKVKPDSFILGLGCFLVTHLIYIYLFIELNTKKITTTIKRKPYYILPAFLYGLLLIGLLYQYNQANFMKIQAIVVIYAFVILTMNLSAFSLYKIIEKQHFVLLFFGATLFVLSDSVIALSNFTPLFTGKEYMARIIIMSFYGVAQYLIVYGYIQANAKNHAVV